MNYLNIFSGKNYQPSSEHIRATVEKFRNAARLPAHEARMKAYKDLHEIDVTDEQEALPPEYQEMLDNDKGFQEFLDKVDKAPF